MKPSIFHRFLLVVLTLLGMVVGLLLLVMATGLYPLDTLRMGIDAYRTQLGTLNFALVMGGTGVVLFLLSLAILVGFNRGTGRLRSRRSPPRWYPLAIMAPPRSPFPPSTQWCSAIAKPMLESGRSPA